MATRKKSEVLHVRITPEIKQIAEKLADKQNRNLSNLIETLLIKEAKQEKVINNGNDKQS